ncbi:MULTISPECIES: cytochrome c oxidase subunit 3 [Halomonadaceae]|jgi:cytochrome c oxidase subunit III|uniref:cytochrome-c oxidase n=1 Tax=Vreelandella titanicae TaxID=664683 RepID=A0A653S6S4_9GAMM|nr:MULTISPECIES: cytochrome c oxidase subunit 3 [Halomonas]NAO98554.1 cytochrome c oxidase subunit 3 [Halomonas sp. MG34]UEQ02063.1 cytochrome c oxidase subunit 3 [Halomonas profundus]KIN12942.1 MFS transporter [Halomonas sp. KHS3]MCD1588380.1 cytochrome c oxidase subunit 3 [Halomonas sp. IOP_14]MCE7520505.1 cytochrome c oxidase subunit 3 [Halomonas titanicae]|tara:strand:- start:4165 stop:5025 length:861 start_codon:yes stop_codon:yes gene_type:complete
MSSGSYYVPASSRWPVLGSVALGAMMVGTGIKLVYDTGLPLVLIGVVGILAVMGLWFRDVISESRGGLYDEQMDRSFRWGMGWFIFSEVMFFAAFFGALFYVRMFAIPWLGGEGAKGVSALLWPDFVATWPLLNPPDSSIAGPEQVFSPWQLPLVNTLILITSSITLTVAHEALKVGDRKTCRNWLTGTVLLGCCFIMIQGVEYYEAYAHYGITLEAGIFGATFFILTGFHGVHVIIGTLILATMLVRIIKGHFGDENHFGFEASCWYWHFVDVVWVGLFIFVYVL